jgi:hypothetical protein
MREKLQIENHMVHFSMYMGDQVGAVGDRVDTVGDRVDTVGDRVDTVVTEWIFDSKV